MTEEQDWKSLCTLDKIEHKNWNARIDGYKSALSDMAKANDAKDPLFNQYLGVMKKMVLDSNVVAQEKALEVVLYYVEESNAAGKVAGDICTGLIAKCISSLRPITKERSVAILKMLIEIEKQEVVFEELLKGLVSKAPKVVVGSIIVFREALSEFGPKVVPIKELFKLLPQLLEDRDKGVRDAGKELIIEICRWIGRQAITPQMSNFKPVQVTELNAEFDKIPPVKPIPSRYLKSQKPKVLPQVIAVDGGNGQIQNAVVNPQPVLDVDPYEFVEPVEVISKIPNDFYDKIEEKKWTDRKEALEVVDKLTNHMKLVPGDFADLNKALLKVISKDTNVVLVVLGAKILCQIAQGLRKKFSPYATLSIQTCLEKFKEKKSNVVKALRDCIDASFVSSSFDAITEDVLAALAHKTPSVRSETCLFLNRIFEKCTIETLTKKHLRTFATNLVKLSQDSVPEVREASFQAVGTAMVVVTEKNMKPYLESVEPVKLARIMECYEKAKADIAQAGVAPGAVVAPTPAVVQEAPKAKVDKPIVPKAAPKKAAVNNQKPVKKPGAPAAEAEIPREHPLSDEDVTMKGTELFGETFMTQIVDKNFKERLAAVQILQEFIKDKSSSEIPSQLLVKVLLLKPGLKDNNFQVLKLKIELIKEIVVNGKFTITIAELCIGDLTEKIGDVKNSEHVKATLTEMSDNLNLQCVASQVIKVASENVNIKNLTEALLWVSDSLKDFGFKIDMKELMPFLKTGLQHTNPAVRQAAMKLVGTMSLYLRDTIATLLKDEKPSTKQLIDQEVEAMKSVDPPVPTRGLKNAKPTAAGDADTDAATAPAVVEIDREELIPRENISAKITEEMLGQLADKSWKVKKEAFDEITKILDKSTGIVGDGLQPMVAAIAKITSDSSKVISKIALTVLSTICKLMTKRDCERFVKTVVPALFSSCSDAKPKSREDSVCTLNAWVEKVGFGAIAEGGMIVEALKVDNPFQKAEILAWLSPHLTNVSQNKLLKRSLPSEFCSEILPIVYLSMEERSPEVRKKAQEAVLPCMLVFGYEEMTKANNKHTKPASKDNIKAHLDKAKELLPPPEASAKQPAKAQAGAAPKAVAGGKKDAGTKKADDEKLNKVKKDDIRRGSSGKISKKEPEAAKTEEVVAMLQKSGNRKQRLIEDSKKKNLTKPEICQQINTQFTPLCSQELMNNLFSTDFKKHIVALDMLTRFIAEEDATAVDATKQNLDLILKWIVVRFDETNPSVVNKGLEYLNTLFTILTKDESFALHPQEAYSFFPDFILKLGDANNNIRANVLKILRLLLSCYQPKNVVPFIERVLFETKVAKVKQGCSEFAQLLIEEERIKVGENTPLLIAISKLVGERDSSIRNAALGCLVAAYNFMGEALYKLLRDLNEKERSMLAERIKRTARPLGASTTTSESTNSSSQATPSLSATVVKQRPTTAPSQAPAKLPAYEVPQALHEEVSLKLIDVADDVKALLQPLETITLRFSGRTTQSVNSNDAITSVIHSINSNDVQTSIQAMAQIDEVIKNQDVRPQLLTYMDNLVMSITMQLKSTLGKLSEHEEQRCSESEITDMFKGMLATLVSIFSHKDLAVELNRDRLMNLMQVILRLVINDQLVALAEGGTIIRGINILSVRILESSDQTRMFSSLLRLMMDCLRNNDTVSKFLQLIFKCIWSMTKNLVNTVESLDLVVLLRDIQTFYCDFPPHLWEVSGQDVPMRTIKTIVYSIISHKPHGGVLEALYQIPSAPGKDLDLYVRKSYAKLKYPIPSVLPTPQTTANIREAPVAPPRTAHNQLQDRQAPIAKSNSRPYLEELKQIFNKIGSPSDNKEGLNNLYDFKQKYPEVDLSRYMKQTSLYFQNSIETGLKVISEERGHIHMSTEHQVNNSGTSGGGAASSDAGDWDYCDMDPETLLRRLKHLRIKAGLDKPGSADVVMATTDSGRDEMDTSTIGALNPSGDGPAQSGRLNTQQGRRMSANDLKQLRDRMNVLRGNR